MRVAGWRDRSMHVPPDRGGSRSSTGGAQSRRRADHPGRLSRCGAAAGRGCRNPPVTLTQGNITKMPSPRRTPGHDRLAMSGPPPNSGPSQPARPSECRGCRIGCWLTEPSTPWCAGHENGHAARSVGASNRPRRVRRLRGPSCWLLVTRHRFACIRGRRDGAPTIRMLDTTLPSGRPSRPSHRQTQCVSPGRAWRSVQHAAAAGHNCRICWLSACAGAGARRRLRRAHAGRGLGRGTCRHDGSQ